MIGRSLTERYFSSKMCALFLKEGSILGSRNFITPNRIGAHACANQTVPHGTAVLGGAVPGTSCQATIALFLRDKSHSPIEGPRIKLALMGFETLG
jgi:hypothetical protein